MVGAAQLGNGTAQHDAGFVCLVWAGGAKGPHARSFQQQCYDVMISSIRQSRAFI
jgi:hypothetical protein